MSTKKKAKAMTPRDLTTITSIALAACGAASVMMIGPAHDDISEARSALAEAQRAVQLAPTLTIESVAWRGIEAKGEALQAHVAEHSDGAIDSAALTQRLYDLAMISGLELSRIQPAPQRIMPTLRPDGTPAAAPQAALRVSLDITATYDAVVQFLEVLEQDMGFVRIESVRLTPVSSDGVPSVRATIESVHFAFDPALAEPPPIAVDGMMTMGVAQ